MNGASQIESASDIIHQWIILTGEYPPQPGGVSDYSRVVAQLLTSAGDSVHVCAPPSPTVEDCEKDRIEVERLPDCFGPCSLLVLHRTLKHLPIDVRLLVQYVPHAFGWKAMNVPFCLWLWTQRSRHEITVMFHEVATPWGKRGEPWRLNLLAAVTRLMAFLVAHSAKRLCVSIPAWKEMLRSLAPGKQVEWLPVPSTVPTQVDMVQVDHLRKHLLDPAGRYLVGHFGTFGDHIAPALRLIVPRVLRQKEQAVFLLAGRHSAEFAGELRREHPGLANRIMGTGELSAGDVAQHLAACDLLVQPYSDGVSSRRTSVMASLALGLPVLTNQGFLTEPIWAQSDAVCLADSPGELAAKAVALLADAPELARLRVTAAAFYKEHFSIEKIVAQLRVTTPTP